MSASKLTEQQLFQALPIISSNLRNINVTEHAEQRMLQRWIDYDDVLDALDRPKQLIEIRYDSKFRNYRYKITGTDKNKHIILAIDPVSLEIIIITVINKLIK